MVRARNRPNARERAVDGRVANNERVLNSVISTKGSHPYPPYPGLLIRCNVSPKLLSVELANEVQNVVAANGLPFGSGQGRAASTDERSSKQGRVGLQQFPSIPRPHAVAREVDLQRE